MVEKRVSRIFRKSAEFAKLDRHRYTGERKPSGFGGMQDGKLQTCFEHAGGRPFAKLRRNDARRGTNPG